jgi:hypothetical protein
VLILAAWRGNHSLFLFLVNGECVRGSERERKTRETRRLTAVGTRQGERRKGERKTKQKTKNRTKNAKKESSTRMACCAKGDAAAVTRTAEIDKKLEADRKLQEQEVKLLLLGAKREISKKREKGKKGKNYFFSLFFFRFFSLVNVI